LKKRHPFYYRLLRPLVAIFLFLRFGYRRKIVKGLPENYIVISNHTTNYDMLLVGTCFKRQMYFVASEHIARWKRAYKLIQYVFDPIIRHKGASAGGAVLDILRKTRKGGNVCVFAEGVRSWDGVTCPVSVSTAQLVKSAGCGLVTFRITGGYFASPMWCGSKIRRGPLSGNAVRIFTKEQLKEMTVEEIHAAIIEDLHEDAYARQLRAPKRYRGKNLAEHLEAFMFICPACGARDSFTSRGNTVSCGACGCSATYDEYGMLHGMDFDTVRAFSLWQQAQVSRDVECNVTYTAKDTVFLEIEKHTEKEVTSGAAAMNGSTFSCGEISFDLSSVTDLAMHDQRALVFTADKRYFELKIPNSNALKFMLYYNEKKKQEQKEKAEASRLS